MVVAVSVFGGGGRKLASRVDGELTSLEDGPPAMTSLFPPAGPQLPEFKSILITGNYHASAPIHLCLSHALQPETTRVVLVVASRSALTASLARLRDEWIDVHGGEGRTSGAASKVQIL